MSTASAHRFWAKVVQAGDCWEWQAAKNNGYGVFYLYAKPNGVAKLTPAHRWSYETLRAEIPEGLVLDHLCRNPPCVNPWHLEPVTSQVNAERGLWGMRTHCPAGHEYAGTNVGRRPNRRGRECVTCRRAAHEERRQANRRALLADPSIAEHGTLATYNGWMCRCDRCRGAMAEYKRQRKLRSIGRVA